MSALIDVKSQAAGKWPSVLNLLGIDSKYFNGKHQDCPLCNDGKDRFRWNRSTEYAHCNHCGSLGPVDLAIAWTGKPYKDAVKEIRQVLGEARVVTVPEQRSDDVEKNKVRLESIHKTLSVIGKKPESLAYFAKRGLSVLPEKDCYFSSSVPYFEDGKKVSTFSAICSVFRTVDGETCSYHITYISADGSKAEVMAPKKILPSIRPLVGSSIQLFKPDKGLLAIAEGIETALAVHQLEGLPVWASGNAQLMETVQIPADVNEVWIYADCDDSFTGQKAAYTLAKRLKNEGKTVRVCNLIDQQWVTDRGGNFDFLDLLVLKNGRSATATLS